MSSHGRKARTTIDAASARDAEELARDRAQDGVERQIVPFRNDVGRRLAGIGRNVIVGMAEIVRDVEHEPGKDDAEQADEEGVLDGRIGRERDGVLLGLRLDAGRVVLPDHVQRPDVQHDHAGDDERQQVVQRIEAVQRRIADRVTAPQPGDDGVADHRDRREQVGDDGRRPEAHLPPRQHVAHEAGHHHQQEQDDAEDPQHLARLLVGAVIHAARDVGVDGDEEERGAVGMQVAQEPTVIHVAHDRFDGIEGIVDMRRVVHRQDDAGDDLHPEHEGENAAERPPIVQIARYRIDDERGMDQAGDRQPALQPLHEGALRRIGRLSAHGRTLCVAERGDRARLGARNEKKIAARGLRCFDCCHRPDPRPSCRSTRPRCKPAPGRPIRRQVRLIRPGEDQKRRYPAAFIGTLAARVQGGH